MKFYAAAAFLALITTGAQADVIAVYNGQIRSSDKINIRLYDEPGVQSQCRAFEHPMAVRASLTWTGVTETTTPYATGCWEMGKDGKLSIAMWTNSTGEPVDLRLNPKDFVRTQAEFALWPTRNSATLEPAVIATATAEAGGVEMKIALTEKTVQDCFGHEASLATITWADQRSTVCWNPARDEVVFWDASARKNAYGTYDPTFVLPMEKFKVAAGASLWR